MGGPCAIVGYRRLRFLGIPLPFFHTFLSVECAEEKLTRGFNALYDISKPLSWLIPVPGTVLQPEDDWSGGTVLLTTDEGKVHALRKAMEDEQWRTYHALLHNCFCWRNRVLRKAGIPVPRDFWWKRAGGAVTCIPSEDR